VAHEGEYVSTRLAQAGTRTFPYFQEAGSHLLADGDLFCIDTDAIGVGGYGVDLSRAYLCGERPPSRRQLELHGLSLEQLGHNSSLLGPGVSFADFARDAWPVPDDYAPHGYYCLAHGLGMSGEYPYVPVDSSTPLDGGFEPGMVICVESYIGDEASHQGVKLEDQFLITSTGAERLTTTPFDARLKPA
jgi:Xaa-Pro aminopeptidase